VSARAGVVVTGTEVLTGRVKDANGPWLADRLLELGVELAHITICGDRPEDMEAQLRFQADQGCDLIVTSGGLGPTADDLTMDVVARFCGRAMKHDPALEDRIQAIVRPLLARYPQIDEKALLEGSRKQATVPEGVDVLEPAGTAPGAVVTPVDGGGTAIVVLPGPPRELQTMWAAAVETEAFQRRNSRFNDLYRCLMLHRPAYRPGMAVCVKRLELPIPPSHENQLDLETQCEREALAFCKIQRSLKQ
jgi:nicotinamide-nucleotide amidase